MSAAIRRVHEAGHAVVGALIRDAGGVRVVSATAAAASPHVVTKHLRSGTVEDCMAASAGVALVALSGPLAELRLARATHQIEAANAGARDDETNARAAVVRLLRLRDGGEVSAAAVDDLVEHLRGHAAELVERAWPLVLVVAENLVDGPLTGAEVDALIEGT